MFKKFGIYYRNSSDENKLLVLVLLILSGLSSLLTLYAAIIGSKTFIITGASFMSANLLLVILLYFNKISYDRTSYFIVIGMFVLLLAGFIFTVSPIEATLYLVAFPVVLIALRPDHEWAIGMFAFISVMVACQIFELTAATYSWEEMTHIWLTLGMTSIFLGFYVVMSRETKDLLNKEQEKLANINESLEIKVQERTEALQKANEQLALDITLDPVTQIMNKRTFMEKLRTQIERFKFDKTRFSIITFDLDDFYQVNHGYGRKVADEILTKIAVMTTKNSLAVDVVARVAGDEFMILMHDMPKEKARERAETIRQHIEWAVFVENHQITASFGVVEFNASQKELDEHIVLHELDIALQTAKHRGKNRVFTAD
jgi:diguanylate cyclase (GGDEF)-like protein